MANVKTPTLTRKDRVLLALARAARSRCAWVSSVELCHPEIGGIDFRRRISELRAEKCPILSRRVAGRPWNEYRLGVN